MADRHLTLVPCDHFWIEVHTSLAKDTVTAICKHKGCRKTMRFSMENWERLAQAGRCLNKPIRV